MWIRSKTLLLVMLHFPLRRKLAAGFVFCLAFMAVGVLPAFAHNAVLTGSVVCNEETGDYDVTWTITNSAAQGSVMTLEESNRQAVPLSTFAPNETKTYVESLPGSTTGTTTLTIRAGWDDAAPDVVRSRSVTTDGTCSTESEPGIDVTKSCPSIGLAGDVVTYSITVTNTGDEALENLVVMDTVDGHAAVLVPGAPTELAVGASVDLGFTYTIQAGDPGTLSNSVTATADGVTSGAEVTDTADCETTVVQPEITVTKTCTPLAHVGDTITYSITVTNTGDEDLTDVTVSDTILGDLSASFAADLAVDASESHDFHYVVQAGDDDLVNVVTATGTGVESEAVVDDTAHCATDVIHPGILIEKSVDEDVVPVGTTVTFTYVVTNTGDTNLYDVSVDDDVLGHIGDISVLEPGAHVTLTADFEVGDEIVTNVATAEGEDALGRSVSSDDAVTVSPIAGENPTPPSTPFTGSDTDRLGLIAIGLFGIGATLLLVPRRRGKHEAA
jgi:uncharacterized repeat protein (TIGR01451 family)